MSRLCTATPSCEQNTALRKMIEEYSERLKTEAHTLGSHGLSENDFYHSGLFRGAIERIRGQFSATMREKREFVQYVLSYMQDEHYINDWESAGDASRHDYVVHLNSGKKAVIELKGCLDGNNTNIFERPSHADEFIIWSVCTNPGADPRHNVWSGIHTRLSAEIISREQRVDGVIAWDMVCGTVGRRCPKVIISNDRLTIVGPFTLPPPCIFMMPGTIPSPRNNPHPAAQQLDDVQILKAFHDCFKGQDDDVSFVDFEVRHNGPETERKTRVVRSGETQQESGMTAIRRS